MKIKVGLAVLLVSMMAQSALAGKIAVFDFRAALLQTDSAKQRSQALQKKPEFAKLVAEAEGLKADMAALVKERESKGLTWSEAQKAENNKKAEYMQADLQLVVQKIQKDQDEVTSVLLRDAQKELPAILEKIVQAEGIDIVLKAEAAYVVMPTADITPTVIAELNKVLK